MSRTLRNRLSQCLGLLLIGWLSVCVSAADAPPVVLIIDTSSSEAAGVYNAVGSVISFMTVYNPISLVTTCASSSSSEATQDAKVLHDLLSSVAACDTFDQVQAVQQAVSQIGSQQGTIIYIMDGQNVSGGKTIATDPMKTTLTQLQEQSNCLYVIPIGDASLPSTSTRSINSNAVKSLVNRAGCGNAYEAQKPETLAGVLLRAYLVSQHRDLLTNGEQLALFDESTAKLSQDITLNQNVESLRVDVVWGKGELDVALEPPSGTTIDPAINSGDGYQSFTIDKPPAGDWNITLSITQVPDNQVAMVLFSKSSKRPVSVAAVQPTMIESPQATLETTPRAETTTEAATSQTNSEASTPAATSTSLEILSPVLIAGLIGLAVVVVGIGVVVWPRRRPEPANSFFDAPSSLENTIYSRTTAELPRIDPSFLALNHNDASKTRTTETLRRISINPPIQGEQFRQFPAKLVFMSGMQQGQFVPVDSGYFTIGRHSANRMRIQDVSVSREHAHIIFDNDQNLYIIENMSQGGTQVNGEMITASRPLYNGDVIKIGTIQMQFQLRI